METTQTATGSKLATLVKCAHAGCACTVSAGEQFCSDHCAASAGGDDAAAAGDCNCGHPECTAVRSEADAPIAIGAS